MFRVTRFAPAPTGLLHLGHVANAIYVWGLAARYGASVRLRIEDHDRQRSRADYEKQLIRDMAWLGFVAIDAESTTSGVTRQSERVSHYQQAADVLWARGLVYGCTCSRRMFAPPASAGQASQAYPGTCREKGLRPAEGIAWRMRIERRQEPFDDLLLGAQVQNPASGPGDPVIRDRHGNWTYQFAAAVDDFLQQIDLVIRGRDLLGSTGLQIQIARTIGRHTPAAYAHHPLIMKSPTQKLSKSDGDTGLAELRSRGMSAPELIGLAAHRVGLVTTATPIRARDVGALFETFHGASGASSSPT